MFLTQGFTAGFNIPYEGPRKFCFSKHLSSLKGKKVLFESNYLELAAGRIAGPFSETPFPNIQVSPLGLVPKKAPNEFRLIHHLSYPE